MPAGAPQPRSSFQPAPSKPRWRRIAKWLSLALLALILVPALFIGGIALRYRSIVSAHHTRQLVAPEAAQAVDWVDPFIGTGGIPWVCAHNFPGADRPFGVMRLGPETASILTRARALNTSGYFYGDDWLLGFSHTRLVGTGATDGGNFLVRPANEPVDLNKPRKDRGTRFSHTDESASPGAYSLNLPGEQIRVELTATERVGFHRYTFRGRGASHLHFDIANALGGRKATEASVKLSLDGRELVGAVRTFGSFGSRYGGLKAYFAARLDPPPTAFGTWTDKTFTPGSTNATGNDVGVDLTFSEGGAPRVVGLQLAISHVSIANARSNLEAEIQGRSFDTIAAEARRAWQDRLEIIRIDGGTPEQRAIYYTALFRCFQMPTVFNDTNGEYLGFDRKVHRTEGFRYFTDMSLWDTFRTTHPLYTLIAPADQEDMVRSLVRMAVEGGWLPRWPSGGGYSNSMFGTPADIVIADTYLKGLRNFDVEKAYEAMRRTALAPTPTGSAFSGRRGVEHIATLGYCPDDLVDESVARTLEYAWADHSIANLAEALGKTEDAALFGARAQSYRKLWNPTTGYFQPRDSKGKFVEPFDPLLLTYLDRDGRKTRAYVEGSALQWRWSVAHDAAGLISLFPDRQTFVRELDSFFARSDPGRGRWNPGSYYWHGNQPDIHAAYLFNDAGRPDLTQRWARWILETKYAATYDGLDGNDDGGTLSAWYVFGALGFHPVPGTDRYQLGSPLFPRAELRLRGGTLTVLAANHTPSRVYVRSVSLNGQKLNRWWIRHSEIAGGGELRFEMSDMPP